MHDSKPTIKKAVNLVRPGRVYLHFKGTKYIVIGITSDCDDVNNNDKKMVHYMSLDTGAHYHRNLMYFISPKVLEDDSTIERFIHCGYATIAINGLGGYEVTMKY